MNKKKQKCSIEFTEEKNTIHTAEYLVYRAAQKKRPYCTLYVFVRK